ncbi:MAG: hypothetical protein KF824_12415 [Fimbriimonadaceae bacterium]|nr:MAG: hypothetical protein KF824_12415 [Fimbriimonadaceae bacterium]
MNASIQQLDPISTQFVEHYTSLAETINDANRYGQSPGLEAKYLLQRTWMQANYRHFKRQLQSYLNTNSKKKVNASMTWDTPLDAFERLFTSPNLAQLLHQDDSTLVKLLNETQSAVANCFQVQLAVAQ